jgi:pantoate--beta-alanine ligase
MGALHEGHVSLARLARAEAGFVVVSIFVNPLQFGPGEDFARYPRREEEDQAKLSGEGVDLLYLPEPVEFYPADFSTAVEVGGVSEGGEGGARPGHFRGVATVVAKLFHQVAPDVAVFGRKDLQQVAVVRRMIRDLDFPIRLVVAETIREPDGLAMSSRNAYLSAGDRRLASEFPRVLFGARDAAARGERDAEKLAAKIGCELADAGIRVEYVNVVDPQTMTPVAEALRGTAIAAAVRIGTTRLIDNVLVP